MIKNFYAILFLLLSSAMAYAQTGTSALHGRILTSDGKPAQGVTIQIVNTKYGVSTQPDGKYLIKLEPGNYTVRVNAIGMITKELPVTISSGKVTEQPDVILQVTSIQLKDVVVTGQYAPQSLKNSVYMVRTITNEQIRLRNPSKVQDVLSVVV